MTSMKTIWFWKKLVPALALLLLLSCFGTMAFAYEAIDADRQASLTVSFAQEDNSFAGAKFRIYRVASVSASTEFTLTGDFANYPVKVNGLDSSGWRALAQTLEGYVARDGLSPLREEQTGADGKALFDQLDTGLYLVIGDRYQQDGYTYTPESFLICLPTLDEETDTWIYDAAATCKYDCTSQPPEGGNTVSRKVLKVWKDSDNKEKRPDEITVQLLCDGQIYDTVALSDSNNWKYTWDGLDDSHRWQVVEYETPEGYTVSVDQQGITFVMTNSQTEDVPDKPQKPDTPTLPQTGMLWWPVPVLAAAGLFLFLLGWRKYRHAER